MLEIGILRDEKERVLAGLKKRGYTDEKLEIIDQIIELDDKRKSAQTALDNLLSDRNSLSAEIGGLFKAGQADKANELKVKVQGIKEEAETRDAELT